MKTRLFSVALPAVLILASVAALATLSQAPTAGHGPVSAAYRDGVLSVSIPYDATRAGAGTLTLEVLDPEDRMVGRVERRVTASPGQLLWKQDLRLTKALALDDLIWHRLRYEFVRDGDEAVAFNGIGSLSMLLRRPIVHVLGQTSYLSGGTAAVRLIATDANNEIIPGPGSVQIQLLGPKQGGQTL